MTLTQLAIRSLIVLSTHERRVDPWRGQRGRGPGRLVAGRQLGARQPRGHRVQPSRPHQHRHRIRKPVHRGAAVAPAAGTGGRGAHPDVQGHRDSRHLRTSRTRGADLRHRRTVLLVPWREVEGAGSLGCPAESGSGGRARRGLRGQSVWCGSRGQRIFRSTRCTAGAKTSADRSGCRFGARSRAKRWASSR